MQREIDLSDIESLSKDNNESEFLLEKRRDAYNLFVTSEIPKFIYGLGMSLDIGNFNFNNINLGKKNKIIVKGDIEVSKEFNKFFSNVIKIDDKFDAFHYAFLNDYLIIKVKNNSIIKEPVEIINNINQLIIGLLDIFHKAVLLFRDLTDFFSAQE